MADLLRLGVATHARLVELLDLRAASGDDMQPGAVTLSVQRFLGARLFCRARTPILAILRGAVETA